MTNQVYIGQVTAGDDLDIDIQIVDEAGNSLDITGLQSAVFKITNGTNTIRKTLGNGVVIASAAGGLLTATATGAETEPLRGLYDFELEIRDVLGRYRTPVRGQVIFRQALIANA